MIHPQRKQSLEIIEQDEGFAPDRRVSMCDLYDADGAYNQMVKEILKNGTVVEPENERTGTGTIRRFGLSYTVDTGLSFPIITTKEVNFGSVAAEYLWFLSGDPTPEKLKEHTSIWDEWCDEDGNLETAYGRYWRDYPTIPEHAGVEGEATHGRDYPGIDQIKTVVEQIKEHPFSRRHLVTAWHPDNAHASKLPPCHHSFILYVGDRGGDLMLNMELNQRSGDMALGIPFNMSGYAMILHLIAQEVGIQPGKLKHNITDAHIYLPHATDLAEQITRTRRGGAVDLEIPDKSLYDLSLSDIDKVDLNGYSHQDPIRYSVAV